MKTERIAVITPRDRFRGSLVGLAVGDALGATVEFKSRGTFTTPTELVGGGPFGLRPGEWTDDTSQALCLAESLVAKGKFDPVDMMKRLYAWMNRGHLSVNGRCFDIGPSSSSSLHGFAATGTPYQGTADRDTNGTIMRLAPVPLRFADDYGDAVHFSDLSARLTHGGKGAKGAARYLGALIAGAVNGVPKATLLRPGRLFEPSEGFWDEVESRDLPEKVLAVAEGSYATKDPRRISGGFGAVDCLEAALWAIHGSDNFEDAVRRVVSLGDDTDTTGAVVGQLAGAIWGLHGIPERWLKALAWSDRITAFADSLYESSGFFKTAKLIV
jgi:ADP-ribosyl-[dinitrogen reductase] hydrolase